MTELVHSTPCTGRNKLQRLPDELGDCAALEELSAEDNYLQASLRGLIINNFKCVRENRAGLGKLSAEGNCLQGSLRGLIRNNLKCERENRAGLEELSAEDNCLQTKPYRVCQISSVFIFRKHLMAKRLPAALYHFM